MSLNSVEQKERRALSKAVARELRNQTKGSKWRASQGWLFREDNGWFIEVRPYIWVVERRSTLELRFKPMRIDPVFWQIVLTEENNRQPLSFRLHGAWTVSTPETRRVDVDEGRLSPAEIASRFLEIASSEFELSRPDWTLERFLGRIQAFRETVNPKAYLPAVICSLVLLDRLDEARAACLMARASDECGGFQVGPKSFVDLALEWLERSPRTVH